MMNKTRTQFVTSAQAKAKLGSSLRDVEQGDIVVITRYGQAVAALVGVKELQQLERLKARSPIQGLAGLAGRWDDGQELVQELDALSRRQDTHRQLPDFD